MKTTKKSNVQKVVNFSTIFLLLVSVVTVVLIGLSTLMAWELPQNFSSELKVFISIFELIGVVIALCVALYCTVDNED
jgi:hypothetical protein